MSKPTRDEVLMGHIAFWEEIALVTIDGWLRGKKRIRDHSGRTHHRLIASIEGMTKDEWMSPRPFEGDRAQDDLGSQLGGVLGAPQRPLGHPFAHLPDLEAYVTSRR